MAKCSICDQTIVAGGYRDNELRFCSLFCYTLSEKSGFCNHCLSVTEETSPGDTVSINFIGTKLFGAKDRCLVCHSVVQTKWVQILLPIIPLGKFRVIYTDNKNYIGRKLKA